MAGEKFGGKIAGSIAEVRFAFSGLVKNVYKHSTDLIKKGEWIASLDQIMLQKELDVQLSDYERERADFEIFNLKNKGTDDLTNYQKKAVQAKLDSSVRAVELAKARMDQVNLVSPVTGLIIDNGGMTPGLNITPSGYTVQILDFSGFFFQFEIKQEKLTIFRQPHKARVHIPNLGRELTGTTSLPLPGMTAKSGFLVNIVLESCEDLLPGMEGEVELTE